MFPRILEPALKRAAAGTYPVVTLTGPRQSGKTTLAKAAFPDHVYVTLEEADSRLVDLTPAEVPESRKSGPGRPAGERQPSRAHVLG